MVRIVTKSGRAYHQPPYTKEEERETYRRMAGGPVTIRHSQPRVPDKPPRKSPPPRAAK